MKQIVQYVMILYKIIEIKIHLNAHVKLIIMKIQIIVNFLKIIIFYYYNLLNFSIKYIKGGNNNNYNNK